MTAGAFAAMEKVEQSLEVYRKVGLSGLFREVTRSLLRPLQTAYYQQWSHHGEITETEISYNTVTVRPYRRLDRFVPLSPPPNKGGHRQPEDYEAGLCSALRRQVQRGDSVVVIGGGLGVTATVAAKQVGEEGHVVCYEGSEQMTEHIHDTVSLNGVTTRISVENRVVGDGDGVIDSSGQATPTKSVDSLPRCDVLEMDVEGAETGILERLTIRPRSIIVETHGNKQLVEGSLQSLGYTVEQESLAEVGPYKLTCERNEIHVLSATLTDE